MLRVRRLPSSIQLRIDDAALDEQLDRLPNESAVRQVEQFNEPVIRARYELPAGQRLGRKNSRRKPDDASGDDRTDGGRPRQQARSTWRDGRAGQ
ncbi:hypothetical protein ACQBAR_12430 [Propionibacteriaceae bacterium Y1685]